MKEELQKIIQALSGEKKSLNIKEISLLTGMNRHTVARKLDTLEIIGRVRKVQIGQSKKYFINNPVLLSHADNVSSDLILIINHQWTIEYVNQITRERFKLSEKDILGRSLTQVNLEFFSSPEIFDRLKNYSPHKVIRLVISWMHNNTLQWYSVSITNVILTSNRNYIAIIASDITEKKRKQDEHIESVENYRSLFEHAPVPINEEDYSLVYQYITDIKKSGVEDLRSYYSNDAGFVKECFKRIKIIQMNHESRKVYCIGPDTHFSPLFDVYPLLSSESIETLKNVMIDLYEGVQSVKEEITFIKKGNWATFLLQMTVADKYLHNLSRVYVSFQNITEKKILEMRLRNSPQLCSGIDPFPGKRS